MGRNSFIQDLGRAIFEKGDELSDDTRNPQRSGVGYGPSSKVAQIHDIGEVARNLVREVSRIKSEEVQLQTSVHKLIDTYRRGIQEYQQGIVLAKKQRDDLIARKRSALEELDEHLRKHADARIDFASALRDPLASVEFPILHESGPPQVLPAAQLFADIDEVSSE